MCNQIYKCVIEENSSEKNGVAQIRDQTGSRHQLHILNRGNKSAFRNSFLVGRIKTNEKAEQGIKKK